MSRLPRTLLQGVCLAPVVRCNLPGDPNGTLAHVQGSLFRAGVSLRKPWTRFEDGQPAWLEATSASEGRMADLPQAEGRR
jgi:hypothetical protein